MVNGASVLRFNLSCSERVEISIRTIYRRVKHRYKISIAMLYRHRYRSRVFDRSLNRCSFVENSRAVNRRGSVSKV